MRKFFLLWLLVFLIPGCSVMGNLQIDDSAGHQAIAYGSGRAMGLAVCKISHDLDQSLKVVADDFMASHPEPIIPGPAIIELHTNFLMQAALHVDDPYGLTGDFSALLIMFGGEYDQDGKLLRINDVPRISVQQFRNGYAVSRKQLQRERRLQIE